MENGKKDEESVNNESHNIGKRSEGEGHSGDNLLLWNKTSFKNNAPTPPWSPRNYNKLQSELNWEIHAEAG